MPRPAFALVETFPVHCPITDALRGSKSRVVRYFETEAFARAVAARMAAEDYETDYEVRDAADPFRWRSEAPAVWGSSPYGADDVIPF